MALDSYTKLLIHFNNTSFTDMCGHTITNNGVSLDTTTKKFGNGSASFNGSNAYLNINNTNDINFNNNDFTIDMWIYPKSNNGLQVLLDSRLSAYSYSGFVLYLNAGTIYTASDGNTNVNNIGTVTLNVWQHVAFVKNNNNWSVFINGILQNSKISSSNLLSVGTIYIGNNASGTVAQYFNGYMDELRVSVGIARWTSNFTPPIRPYNTYFYLINDNSQYKYFNKTTFLMSNLANNPPTATDYRNYGNEDLSYLCTSYNQEVLQMNNFQTLGSGKYSYVDCNNKFLNVNYDVNTNGGTGYIVDSNTLLLIHMDDNTFKDECGHTVTNNGTVLDIVNKKFGNGSGYFNGTSATYLSSIIDGLNNSYTIDFWFNLKNNTGTNIFFTSNDTASLSATNTRCFGYKNGSFVIIGNSDAQIYSFITYSININQWYHCAYEWDGTNTSLYINGNIIKSVANNYLLRYFIKAGIDYYNYHFFNGNIDEFRISNVARWVSNFNPINVKYLIQDNTTNTIYTYNGVSLIQSPSQTIDSSNFLTNGFNDLTVMTNTIWTNVFSDITHARVLCYTSDSAITENDLICDINSYRPIDDLQNQFIIDLFQDGA